MNKTSRPRADTIAREVWRTIPGWDGFYEVSDRGRVRSVDRVVPHSNGAGVRKLRGRVLAQKVDDIQRHRVGLCRNGTHTTSRVHLLVLRAFVGPKPAHPNGDRMDGSHKDGDAGNNLLSNLTWETHAANERRKSAHGTRAQGETHGGSRLTNREVLAIVERLEAGEMQASIASDFGVCGSLISLINTGDRWAHLTGRS